MEYDIRKTTDPQADLWIKGNKPYRWYLRDEYLTEYWPTNRYLYKLFGPVFTSETGSEYPTLYKSYFGCKERWFSEFSYTSGVFAPYIKYGNGGWSPDSRDTFHFQKFLNLKGGYRFSLAEEKINNKYMDTLNSGYETWSPYTIAQFQTATFNDYYTNLHGSPLCHHEKGLYDCYFNPDNRNYLYYGNRWYGQFFELVDWQRTIVNWQSNTDTIAVHVDYRPKTGEEIRLWSNNLMIMGAKGIFTDGEITVDIQNFFRTDARGRTATKLGFTQQINDTILDLNNNDALSFILDDRIGTDFIVPNDPSNIYNLINFDTCKVKFRINKDRVYVGQKSNRLEIFKEFTKIRYTQDELLKLNLIGWYGKGFKSWTHQDTTIQIDVINTIFDLDQNKLFTKKNWNYTTNSVQIQRESWDSSFFDLTVLKYDSLALNKKLAIGIQNRRTDPLVLTNETYFPDAYSGLESIPEFIKDTSMKFYPTAEFDYNCLNGGYVQLPYDFERINGPFHVINEPAPYWQDLYWKRLGIRILNVPLKMSHIPADSGFYLTVKELGVGTPLFTDTLNYWTQPKFYSKIDTTLLLGETLVAKMLPGQGKIVSCEVNNIFYDWCGSDTMDCNELNHLAQINIKEDDFYNPQCCFFIELGNSTNCPLDNIVVDINIIAPPECLPSIMGSFQLLDFGYDMEYPEPNHIRFIKRNTAPFQLATFGRFCIQDHCDFCMYFKLGRKINNKIVMCGNQTEYCNICENWEIMNNACCNSLEVYSAPVFDTKTQKNDYNIYAVQNDSTKGKISKAIVTKKKNGRVIDKLEKAKNEKRIDLTTGKKIAKSKMENSNGKDTLSIYFYDENDSLVCVKDLIIEEVNDNLEKSIEYDEEPTESNSTDSTDLTLQYFPNPVEDKLNIEVKSVLCKKVKVRITNLKSIEIFSKELKTNNLTQISTEEIPNGVYFLKIEDCESDKFIIKKIVIRK